MPLVAWAALAVGLGLLIAPNASSAACLGLIVLSSAGAFVAIVRRRGDTGACLALAAAGLLIGLQSDRTARQCIGSSVALRRWQVELSSAAAPGAVAHAVIHRGACRLSATLLVSSGRARAGDRAIVRGDAAAGAHGLVVRHAGLTEVQPARALARLRARAGARIDRIFTSDAPLVRALVLADMSLVPAEQRDRFARAGLVHMLSVSGLHVAIIALALELLASVLRLPAQLARVTTITLLALYVAGIGAPAPAVRAAVMLGLVVATRALQRPTSAWAIVAVGSAAPLIQPATVLDLGWQLSVAGTIALVAGGTLASRVIPTGWRGPRRGLARALAVSVVATLATAPPVAWSFGRISLVGPATNLVADPVMAVLQPVLFLALCVPLAPVERLAADAAHALIAAFDAVATVGAQVPHGAPVVLPTLLVAWAGGLAAVAVIVACVSFRPARASLVALACVAAMIVEPLLMPSRPMTELHMLDVGQGDALALRTRAGRWIVIDAGRTWRSGDAGESVVVPYLARRGGPVALFVLSHPHADHVGGAASLLSALRPARFLDPGYVGTTPSYRAALTAARAQRIPWQRVRPGDSVVVDEIVLTALAPDSAWVAGLHDANLASTVLIARIGEVRMLFTGDAEEPEEEWLLAHAPGALQADVLKVAHHGSETSTSPRFLDAVSPRLALVSVGADNTYGHPDRSVLAALGDAAVDVLRTDLAGTVVVRTDGRLLEVEARGMRWSVATRQRRRSTAPVP
jgi:competence protein ComEC